MGISQAAALGAVLAAAACMPAYAQTAIAKANAEASPEVRYEITELKRTSGNTVTLKAVIVNDSPKVFSTPNWSTVYLLNAAGRVKHTVAKDEGGRWVASANTNVNAKTRREFWAKFQAPPEGVERMTVVVRGFAPMEDVKLDK